MLLPLVTVTRARLPQAKACRKAHLRIADKRRLHDGNYDAKRVHNEARVTVTAYGVRIPTK